MSWVILFELLEEVTAKDTSMPFVVLEETRERWASKAPLKSLVEVVPE